MKCRNSDFEKVHSGKSELFISQNEGCATAEVVENLVGLLATFSVFASFWAVLLQVSSLC